MNMENKPKEITINKGKSTGTCIPLNEWKTIARANKTGTTMDTHNGQTSPNRDPLNDRKSDRKDTSNRYGVLQCISEDNIHELNSARAPKGILITGTKDKDTRPIKKVRFKNHGKKRNRKKGKSKNKIKNLRIMYVNVNGIKDKVISLQSTAAAYDAHIIAVTETKQIPPQLKGYGKWKSKERKNKGGGGVAIAARSDINAKITKIDNLEDDDQDVVWVELKKSQKESLFIGTYYGKQEKHSREEVQKEYEQLNTQINMLKPKGEIILTGDFNAKLKINEGEYVQELSPNGKHLQNIIEMNQLEPVSLTSKSGKWTRQNRHKIEEKSIIDYVLTTKSLAEQINEITVDECGTHRIKGKKETDHNTIMLDVNMEIIKENKLIKRWKLNNKEGWKNYNEELQKEYQENEPKSQEELQNLIKKVMKKTIGQVTIKIRNNKMKEKDRIKELRKLKNNTKKEYEHAIKSARENIPEKQQKYFVAQKKLKEEIEKAQKEITKKKLEKLAEEGNTKSITFWKMKAQTEKQSEQEPYDLITEENEQMQGPEETKNYIANYFENLYQARPSKPEYIKETETIENTVKQIEIEMSKLPEIEEFNQNEINKAIKRLKRKKALGPDEIPNEAFIEADQQTRLIYLKSMNKINKEMLIPEIWQEGEIIRLFKGKGIKGKCSNERGITLSSNFGKLYERIINERVLKDVNISDAQAGGKRGAATVDHILLAKELIATAKRNKKDAYIAFLDVTKAYDKAWLTGIMEVMYKEGLRDNHWTIVKRLNENLKAQIQTKHGNTRTISIKDSIRQGGVLSTTMYGLLMDEVSKEIKKENLGIKIEGLNEKQGSLLWVDDVLLITTDSKEFQKSLDITNETSNKYHVEYGEPKSNVLKIKHTRAKKENETFNLGEMQLKNSRIYKYLGLLQNDKNNLDDHMNSIKGKTEAAYQKMMALTGNSDFMQIEMETIWTVVQACIIPIIVYAGETWEVSQKSYKPANMIMDNIIKRILKTPKGTPREALYMETGLLDPEAIIMKNRITMEARLKKVTIK